MPIYEYQCRKCGHRLEVIQKLSDARLRDCPECGAPSLERLVSAAAFRLKGGGWYETDFKSGNKRNVAQSDTKGDKDAKGDKKTAAADTKTGGKSSQAGSKDKVATSSVKKSPAE